MTSVGFFFVCLPLTSDEIKNVARLSPRREMASLRIHPRRFLFPRTFCYACGNTSDRNRRRPGGWRQETPLSSGCANTMTNIFLTVALHRTIVAFQSPSRKTRTFLSEPWKTLERVVVAPRTQRELDSSGMINSLLPKNYLTPHR